jgi:hypothetical protein
MLMVSSQSLAHSSQHLVQHCALANGYQLPEQVTNTKGVCTHSARENQNLNLDHVLGHYAHCPTQWSVMGHCKGGSLWALLSAAYKADTWNTTASYMIGQLQVC